MKVLVVIPTYNEIESLPGALDRVRAADYEIGRASCRERV